MARVQTLESGEDHGSMSSPLPETMTFTAPGVQPGTDWRNDPNYINGGFAGPSNTGITGYGRPGGVATPAFGTTQSNPYVFNQGTFENAFQQAIAGKSGSLQEWQSSIFPALQSQFPDIQSFGSKGDKIRLPNGQTIDAVLSAGTGGRGYALNYDNPMSGYFSDPLLQGYLNFGQGAIDQLMGPQSINPVLQQAIDALTKMSSQGAPHMDMSYLQPMQAAVTKRLAQIDQPGFSPAQQDILRTQVSDPLEAQRDAARQQVLQHFAAQGFGPTSGVVQQALLDSDRAFSQQRTTGERDLATKEMAQDEARKQEAVQISQLLSQLGLSGSSADLQGQIAGRGQNLGAAGQLAGIGGELQDAPLRNMMSAMGIYGNMAQLPFQANQNAIASMNAVNGQNVPQDPGTAQLIQLLMGLSGQGEGAYNTSLQNNSQFWDALGQSMPQLIQMFSTLYGQKGPGQGGAPGPGEGGSYG